MMRLQTGHRGRTGVTLTELILVLAIVALLATMAVPVVMNRRLASQYAAAKAEVEALAKAEEMCGIMHGVYVPLQVLDDIPSDVDSSGTLQPPLGGDADHIGQETDMSVIFTDISVDEQLGSQEQLDNTDPRTQRARREWQGPFAQFQRVFVHSSTIGDLNNPSRAKRDFPLDPWGNPYRLYCPLGIVGSSFATTVGSNPPDEDDMNNDTFSNGVMANRDRRFDRFAVVSFGPDGISDRTDSTGGNVGLIPSIGDDVVYLFGRRVRPSDPSLIVVGTATATTTSTSTATSTATGTATPVPPMPTPTP